ncbi:MAG: PstS family phosphate ABC transporter substrate-binding protein, partial [Planctomycetes bacterium]|nr:PstS family phosphate ABC transporter substrate-binding protein [Planctomycetota bacterium]
MLRRAAAILLGLVALLAGGAASPGADELANLRGRVRVDGSSTVFPITEAVAEEFARVARRVRVTVGVSGTGGGFKRFCTGLTDVSNASRPISATEVKTCAEHGVEFIELPVAYDGLCVVVNPGNDWVRQLTVEQIRKIYGSKETARTWRELDPAWPDRPIRVYSPGTDSGTFDYFREVVLGSKGTTRPDMSVSEDDNILVTGVAGDRDAIGFFGFAYYVENRDKVKAVPIDGGAGPVLPSDATIIDGTYRPFSRPLLIYVSRRSAERSDVQAFIDFYLDQTSTLVPDVD